MQFVSLVSGANIVLPTVQLRAANADTGVANHNEPKLASLVSLARSSFAVDAACTFALGRLVGNVFATAVDTQLINTRFPTERIWQTRLAVL